MCSIHGPLGLLGWHGCRAELGRPHTLEKRSAHATGRNRRGHLPRMTFGTTQLTNPATERNNALRSALQGPHRRARTRIRPTLQQTAVGVVEWRINIGPQRLVQRFDFLLQHLAVLLWSQRVGSALRSRQNFRNRGVGQVQIIERCDGS